APVRPPRGATARECRELALLLGRHLAAQEALRQLDVLPGVGDRVADPLDLLALVREVLPHAADVICDLAVARSGVLELAGVLAHPALQRETWPTGYES